MKLSFRKEEMIKNSKIALSENTRKKLYKRIIDQFIGFNKKKHKIFSNN
jgi:hypothetical protein